MEVEKRRTTKWHQPLSLGSTPHFLDRETRECKTAPWGALTLGESSCSERELRKMRCKITHGLHFWSVAQVQANKQNDKHVSLKSGRLQTSVAPVNIEEQRQNSHQKPAIWLKLTRVNLNGQTSKMVKRVVV